MKLLKPCLILSCFMTGNSVLSQNIKTHINTCFSIVPGIGIVRYDTAKRFGIGLSAYKKLFDRTRSIEVLGIFEGRRYAPAYVDMHLDFMFGSKSHRQIANPFLYGYYGAGVGNFIEYDPSISHSLRTSVNYEKFSFGAGINLLTALGRIRQSSINSYFLFGFSLGYKTVESRQKVFRYGSGDRSDHFAARFHIGFLLSAHN